MTVPLKILITDSSLLAVESVKEQIDKLEKAGHSIIIDDSLKQFDFITGPNCWLLRPEVAGLFTMAVTNARKIANADQERVEQVRLTKTRKAPAKRARKVSTRSTQAETVTGSGNAGGDNDDGTLARAESRQLTFTEST